MESTRSPLSSELVLTEQVEVESSKYYHYVIVVGVGVGGWMGGVVVWRKRVRVTSEL